MYQKCSLQEKEISICLNARRGQGGAGAALPGTEGGSAAILGIELGPGGKPGTSAETARSQRGLGHRQGQDTMIRAHCARQECEQTLPLALR